MIRTSFLLISGTSKCWMPLQAQQWGQVDDLSLPYNELPSISMSFTSSNDVHLTARTQQRLCAPPNRTAWRAALETSRNQREGRKRRQNCRGRRSACFYLAATTEKPTHL